MTRSAGRRRWAIGLLLGVGVLVNYFDRIDLSVAAPQSSSRFGLTPTELGLLFSGYAWTYASLQIPSGMALDRLGVAFVGRAATFLWAADPHSQRQPQDSTVSSPRPIGPSLTTTVGPKR